MNADVIVIGAGIAGLAAAAELGKADLRVAVLEARERAGGRIYTLDAIDNQESAEPIELGAEFVHGVAPEIFDVVRAANLNLVETSGKSWCARNNADLRLCDEQPETGENRIWRRLENYRGKDLSIGEFLQKHCAEPDLTDARASISNYISGFHAAEPARAGVFGIARTTRAARLIEGDRAFRFPAGYKQIVAHFYEQCVRRNVEFHFGCAVEKVRWKIGGVEIVVRNRNDQSNRVFTTPKAVITLPLGVLQARADEAGSVAFEPELSEKKEALSRLEMGAAARVVLRFKRDWWTEILNAQKSAANSESRSPEQLGFLLTRNQPFTAWWTQQPLPSPILTAWTGGANARQFAGRDTLFAANVALKSLAEIFKIERFKIENELKAAHFHDWQTDLFARGAYSYVAADGLNAGAELARPLANTLFFAGEATDSEGHLGTVHGAIASGNRAAREIKTTFERSK